MARELLFAVAYEMAGPTQGSERTRRSVRSGRCRAAATTSLSSCRTTSPRMAAQAQISRSALDTVWVGVLEAW